MHVIIEGTDKVGKSTLAQLLSKKLYFPVVNRLKPKDNIFIECIDFLASSSENMIVDRFHLSEEAYGPVKRSGSRFDLRQLRLIELACLSLNTINIYCKGDIEIIKKRMIELKEDFITTDEVKDIIEHFEIALEKSILNWHIYEIGDDIDELAAKINKAFIENNVKKNYDTFNRYRTTGSYNGKVLIFGEKYGPGLLPPRIPFGNNLPGLQLFEALDKSVIPWNEIIISNSIKNNEEEVDDEKAIIDEVDLKNVEKIICLGNNAYENVIRILNKYNIDKTVEKIPHPLHWFTYGKESIENYTKLFNNIYE